MSKNQAKNLLATLKTSNLISPDIVELVMEFPEPVDAVPGQYGFFDLGPEFVLRRAFSIGQKHDEQTYSFFIKVVGKATGKIMRSCPKQSEVLFPLGNGFPLVKGEKVLLLAGGCGFFPLLYLGQSLLKDNEVSLAYGTRLDGEIVLADRIGDLSQVKICTEQGGAYQMGLVTDLVKEMGEFDRYYVCGPEPMIRALIPMLPLERSFYSLEEKFACGYGVCLGCSIETVNGMKRVCKEGPVFSGLELSL